MNKLLFMLATMITVVASIEIQATEIHTGKAKKRVYGNSSPVSLTTSCEPITQLPWTTGLESDEDNQIPDCWNTLNSYQGYPSVKSSPVYSYAGNKMLEFHANTEKSIAVLPAFATSLDELQLSFYTRREGTSSGTFYIGYLTDVTNANTFVVVDSITSDGIGDNNYHFYEIPFVNVTISEGVTPRIAFAYTCNYNWYWFIDNITVDEIPACSRPTQISTSVTSSTATINWTSTGTEFEIYYKASDTAEYTLANDFSATDLIGVYTITLENLAPATQYSYYIKAICEDTIQSEVKTFKTGCVALNSVPQSWGFETYEQDTYLPACWTNISTNGYSTSRATNFYANSGSYSLSVESDCITVLPLIDSNQVDINSLQLRFYAMCPTYSYMPSTLEVGVMTDVTDASTFEVISSVGVTTGLFEEKQVMFSAYQGNGQYIAIRKQNGGGSTYIDDINLEIIPDCPPVQNIVATSITSDSVTFTWTGNNNSYLVRYKVEGETQWSTDNITSSGASAIISGLSANTNYIVSVAPDCEETTDSTYRTLEFTTLCATENIPYFMDFENESVFNCWTVASQSADMYYYTSYTYPYIDSTSSNANSSTHSLMVGGANNAAMVLVAPKVNLNIEKTRLQFCVRKLSLSGLYGTNQFGNIEIGVMTNPNDTNTFVSLTVIEDSVITTDYSWQTIDFNQFTQYTGNNYYVAIKYLGKVASYTYTCGRYCIDDIKIDLIPSCAEVTGIAVSNITSNSVDISWTSGATDFKVYYKPITAGDDIDYSSVSASLINGIYTLQETDIQPATTYNFYVATICSDSTESNSLTYTFTTACSTLNVPYSTGFEDVENYSTPLCWSFINGITVWEYAFPCVSSSSYSGHNSSKGLEFHSTSDTSTAAIAVLPAFDTDLNQLSVSFWTRPESNPANNGYNSGRLDVGYVTDLTNASTFVMLDSISVYDLVDSAYHKYRVDFNNIDLAESTTGYIAFRHVTNGSGYYWYLDDVTVEEIPACYEPTHLISNNASSTSIDLTWMTTETNVILYYKESSATTFDSITNVSLDENGVYTLESLQPNTTYNWKVGVLCSDDNETYISEIMTFTTDCAALTAVPQSWDFETYEQNTGLPSCWTKSGVYPTVQNMTSYGGVSAMRFYGYGIGVLPQIDTSVLSLDTLQLSFYAKTLSVYGNDCLEVGVMTDPTDTSTFTIVTSIGLQEGPFNLYEVPLFTYNGNGTYIALRITSPNTTVYVDDVTLDFAPACTTPNNVEVTTVSNQATVSWASTGESFEIYYKENSAANYNTPITTVTAGETFGTWTATISGLNPATLYNVYVKTICGEESQPQSQVVSFRSECGTISNFPYTEDFETLSTSDLGCWTNENVSDTISWNMKSLYGSNDKVVYRTFNEGATYFISPVFDITSITSPTLSYDWEVCEDNVGNKDSLYVCYRTNSTSDWIILASYGPSYAGYFTGSALTQTDSVALPNASDTYQIAFLASCHGGYGVYLDNVVINGEGVTPVEPTVATNVATNIAQTSATLNGTITDAGNQTITAKGFEWKATNGGSYTQVLSSATGNTLTYNLTNLTANTSYTYKAFATTANGTVYGTEQVFTTLQAGDEPCTPLTASITETLCYGETFTFNGQTYNATGTYTTTVAGQNGDCDTLYTINLTILPQNAPINDEVTISQSELPYSYHGQTYTDFGTYTLTTQDENGCDQVYNLTLVHNSGISEVEGGLTISLYPNPTDNNATLRVKGLSEQATIIITDQQGRVVSTKVLAQGTETLEIETVNLASGVYYIRIQTANTIKTEKLIKK